MLEDQVGKRFGRLTVISRLKKGNNHHAYWFCICDCGSTHCVRNDHLLKSFTRSCGCLNREVVIQRMTTHGRTRTTEFKSWTGMKERCYRPSRRDYKNYGERGIRVCDEWLHDFQAFHNHVGPKPSPKHSIDRIDNGGNYEPGNVRWATPEQQSQNRRAKGGRHPHAPPECHPDRPHCVRGMCRQCYDHERRKPRLFPPLGA